MKTYINIDDPNFAIGNTVYYKVNHYDQNNKFTHFTWQEINSTLSGYGDSKLMTLEVDKSNICANEDNEFLVDNHCWKWALTPKYI